MTPIDEALGIYKRYTRETAPNDVGFADPNKPYKDWYDPDGTVLVKTYSAYDGTGKQYTFQAEPRELNLPGSPRFPVYEPNKIGYLSFISNTSSGIRTTNWSPSELVSEEQAKSLVAEIAADTGYTPKLYELNISKFVDSLATPTRGEYVGALPGYKVFYLDFDMPLPEPGISVAQLLVQKNRLGVGYPGKWTRTGNAYIWRPKEFNHLTGPGSVPFPHRDLKPNEKITITPFGPVVTVEGAGQPVPADVDKADYSLIIKKLDDIITLLTLRG